MSGVYGLVVLRLLCIKLTNTLNPKKMMILIATEHDIKISVLFFRTALLMPMAISTGNILVRKPCFSRLLVFSSLLPVTAFKGETRAAFLAGSREAI
jgi:hypothetical protein